MGFFEELKRRSVFRVGIAYVVVSWLIIQVVETILPSFGFGDNAIRGVVILLAIGFLPTLILAWVFEFTPEGIKREIDVDPGRPVARQTRRKLDRLIIVGLILVLAYFAWDKFLAAPTAEVADAAVGEKPEKSLAVLPFVTRSDQKADEYFSQGIHDDLLTQLAKIDGMRVVSRTSVMRYAGTTKPIAEIARELGVTTILEGGIQRAGDRVRINAQLIEADTDSHLWAETWDKELTAWNIFEIQSELATMIASALESELTPGVQARIEDKPTDSIEAWDLTLRGRYLMDKELSEENLISAAALFRQAIEADPGYAEAWAGLSQALQELVGWHYRPEKELWPEAWQAAEKAVELDPDSTAALMALGDLQRMGRRYQEGEKSFLRAIELSPGSADAHGRYSDLLRDAQRFDESVREIRRAVELNPHLIRIRESLLQNVYFSRDFDSVYEEADAVLELEPGAAGAWYWLSLTQAITGKFKEAELSMLKAIELDPGNSYYGIGLAYVYAWNDRREQTMEILETADEKGYSMVEIGLVFSVLGDLDTAFDYMDRAFEESPASLYYLAADPSADPMRGDPRWQELLDRLEAE